MADPAPRRQARGLERRELIVRSALTVVGRDGIGSVTHRSVATEADIPFASIAYYFDSKADMLRAALVLFVDEEVGRLRELATALHGAQMAPSDIAEAFASLLEADDGGTLQQFEIYLEASRDEELQATAARCFAAYDEVARLAIAAAGIPPERAPDPAAFVALVDGLALRRMGAPRAYDGDVLRRGLLALLS